MGKRSRRRGEPEEAVPASSDGETPESDGTTAAAAERGVEISDPDAREAIYGMPYDEWKAKYQK